MSQGRGHGDLDRWSRKNREPITDDFKAGLLLCFALEGLVVVLVVLFFSLNTVEYYVVGLLAAIPFLVWMRLWNKRPPQN